MSERYREGVKSVTDAFLLSMPGVKGGKAFGYPAYKIAGKVFAFVGGDGIALKLPPERVQGLIEADAAMRPFEPKEGVIWKSWVSINRPQAEDYQQDLSLMEAAAHFVLG